MTEKKENNKIIIKDHFKEIYFMTLFGSLFFLSIVILTLLAILDVQINSFTINIVLLFFYIMVSTPFLLAGISFYYVAFYGDPLQSVFKKQKFIISEEKIMLDIPFYRKKKNFEIYWDSFSRIEIKRAWKERYMQRKITPKMIFSYDINFMYPERIIRINSNFRMFHIKKIVEILDHLIKYAENKNKEVWIENDVRDFLKYHYNKYNLL